MASPAIGVRKRFLAGRANIDYSHPLANGLIFCAVPNQSVDLVRHRKQLIAQNVYVPNTNTQSPFDPSKFGPGPSMYLYWFDSTFLSFASGAFSVAAAGNTRIGTTGALFGRGYYYYYAGGWHIVRESDSKWNFKIINNAQDSLQDCKASFTSAGGDNVVIGTSNGVDARKIYVDGVLGNTVSTLVNTTTGQSSNNYGTFVGNGYFLNGWSNYYPTTIACAWNRELSDIDVRMFSDDPFCMLRT